MNLSGNITGNLPAPVYERKQIRSMLDELCLRPRPGDQDVYRVLDELNNNNDALSLDNLTQVYRQASNQLFGDTEKIAVRDAIARRQSGFALQLATQVATDGQLSEAERVSLADITSQCYTVVGTCGDLPRLGYQESLQLTSFMKAPSQQIRVWMLQQANKSEVGVEAAQELAEMLFADGGLNQNNKEFIAAANNVFGVPIKSEAQMFIRALGTTDLEVATDQFGTSLLDEARSKDYWSGNSTNNSHVQALAEAINFTRTHLK